MQRTSHLTWVSSPLPHDDGADGLQHNEVVLLRCARGTESPTSRRRLCECRTMQCQLSGDLAPVLPHEAVPQLFEWWRIIPRNAGGRTALVG